jgi:imidazolonepropionase-like amidohydrolase
MKWILWLCLVWNVLLAQSPFPQEFILSHGTLWNPDEPPIQGHLWVKSGQIVQVGNFEIPPQIPCYSIAGSWVLPGWIDSHFHPQIFEEEGSSEVIATLQVLDAVDRHHLSFQKALSQGVTTVAVSSSNEPVIGARSTVLKTSPLFPPLDSLGDLKMTLGRDPVSFSRGNPFNTFYNRRPQSRMGLYQIVQSALYEAEHGNSPALEALHEVKAQKISLRIHAELLRDIQSALRLTSGWNIPFLLEGGTESFSVLADLKARGVGLLYAPSLEIPEIRYTGDWYEEHATPRFTLPLDCLHAQVPFALTSSTQQTLRESALHCMRLGVPPSAILKALTIQPALFLKVDHRVGSLQVGKDADLLLFQGHPFELTSVIQKVFIQGQPLYQKSSS